MGDQSAHRNARARRGLQRDFKFLPVHSEDQNVDALPGALDSRKQRRNAIVWLNYELQDMPPFLGMHAMGQIDSLVVRRWRGNSLTLHGHATIYGRTRRRFGGNSRLNAQKKREPTNGLGRAFLF
jgi:hypothetical protein